MDQRTGHRLDVLGTPVTSADGRFVVLTSPGLNGASGSVADDAPAAYVELPLPR